MKVKKNALSRVIAILMAVALAVGLVPVNMMGTVNAAKDTTTSSPEKVTIAGKDIYIYGGNNVKNETEEESENYVISYTGKAAENVVVYSSKAEVISGAEVTKDEASNQILIGKNWLEQQSDWIAICIGNANMAKVSGYELEPKTGLTYNGKEQELLKKPVQAKNDDKVTYYLNEKEVSGVPKAENAGEYEVGVKITREGYAPFEKSVDVTIAKREIAAKISVKAAEKVFYDGKAHEAVEIEGDLSGYTVEYYKKNGSTFAKADGKETEAGKYTYKVYIYNDNEEFWSNEVTFTIEYVVNPPYKFVYDEENVKTKTVGTGKNETVWYSGDVKIIPNPKDPKEEWEIKKSGDKEFTESITVSNDGIYDKFNVRMRKSGSWLTDIVKVEKFAIDKTAPTATSIEYSIEENNEGLKKFFHIISFGYLFRERMEIIVKVDDGKGIGVDYVVLKLDDDTELKSSVDNKKSIFTYDKTEYEGTIQYKVVDKLGNTDGFHTIMLDKNEDEAEEKSGFFILDQGNPIVENLRCEANETTGFNGVDVYNGHVSYKFSVEDEKSGIKSVKAKINGKSVDSEKIKQSNEEKSKVNGKWEITTSSDYSLSTEDVADLTVDAKGSYILKITVEDNAGNITTKELVTYQDQTAPEIRGFEFLPRYEGDSQPAVDETSYGFFFKENVEVRIHATDCNMYNDEVVAGVKSITYKLVEKGKNIADVEEITGDLEEGKDYIKIDVPKDFKGQIYAYATDKVGNTDTAYVHPEGTVYESWEKHNEESSIKITASKKNGTQKDNTPLYNGNVNFGIAVVDKFSGIKNVKCEVIKSGEGQGTVLENINVSELDSESKWIKETDSNLITKLKIENEIIVDANEFNCNNLTFKVTLTDNAGNTSSKSYKFGIDKTAPVVSIEYKDKPSGDASYFNSSRKATITVKDQNFDKNGLVVAATRTTDSGKKINFTPEIKWNSETTGSGHNTTYTGTIVYSDEGDYTFKVVSCTDRAGNKTTDKKVTYKGSSPKAFTIDKTDPTISVSYNNNSAQNGKYFKANRTATVVIKEHNFDTKRVNITMTARKNGSSIGVPGVSWRHSGNTHTATIAYNNDGDYTFDIAMTDKAARKNNGVNYGSAVAGKEFTVDTTITDPTIDGVKDGHAYPDDVIPTTKFDDINFDNVDVKLVRTTKGKKNVDVTAEFIKGLSKNGQGGSGRFDTFKKLAENDGIYTLTVTMTDKAGNKSEKSVTFTVNRYGSVYVFDDYLASLQGAYVQKVDGNIVITEYNASKLVKDSLKIEITRDGSPIANPSYKVSPVINDKAKVGTSGWYQYEYTIDASNFEEDGVYKITVASEDAAGNKPGTENYEDCEMLFNVDSTPAEITNVTGLENAIVNADKLEISMEVFDAIGLKSVTVYVNDKAVKVFENMEDLINFMGTCELDAGANQKIKIVVEDLAGNITDTSSEDFEAEYEFNDTVTVSTSFFVRWFANKPVFYGSIAGIIVVAAGLVWILIAKRKKEEEAR